ncbi:MAG: tRNA pseudouridine(38-40) synthase TruA [Bacteroidota bacterium]
MRYFAELAYKGTAYVGWQKQPGQLSLQSVIEQSLSKILRGKTEVVGCGRTDAGVHARHYVLHFDHEGECPESFLRRLNKVLPDDIAFSSMRQVKAHAHARYAAYSRSYEYHLLYHKDPFQRDTAYYFPMAHQLDVEKLNWAAALLLDYEEFFPFCKSNTDVKTMRCELKRSEWEMLERERHLVFHIQANRFLRGMVRLIVGMCLNVATGKLSLEMVKQAMDRQERMTKSLSVPAQGLYLTDIRYPDSLEF